MWTCQKCRREFKNANQDHYCGTKPATIDEYIAQAPEEHREILQRVRETIHNAAPNAIEKLSWSMPTFWQKEYLIHFAVFKKHLGLYPGGSGVCAFAERLSSEGYKFSKGAIQIPWNKPMPYDLIAEITHFKVKEVEENTDES